MRERYFSVEFVRLEKRPWQHLHICNGIFFKNILQILRAWLAVARMTARLRAEDFQRAQHTFLSGSWEPASNYVYICKALWVLVRCLLVADDWVIGSFICRCWCGHNLKRHWFGKMLLAIRVRLIWRVINCIADDQVDGKFPWLLSAWRNFVASGDKLDFTHQARYVPFIAIRKYIVFEDFINSFCYYETLK